MTQTRIHYIYDPLCGWCYGVAPLITAAREIADIEAHAGGMMAGAQQRAVTPGLRQFVVDHDLRIAQASGQPFADAYTNGLLRDNTAVLDSGPPITAVLAAEQMARRGLDMLARLQNAHYVEGRRIADTETLYSLAGDIGLDGAAFDEAFDKLRGEATKMHIDSTRALMAKAGAQGFPYVLLEQDGSFAAMDITAYLGRPQDWRGLLERRLAISKEAAGKGALCTLEGCAP
ncbi:MAG: DsbA family protein [Comamonadaceae bacterium]|nr:MAG: DsbA family protein [Comamonadaceae bacterium]